MFLQAVEAQVVVGGGDAVDGADVDFEEAAPATDGRELAHFVRGEHRFGFPAGKGFIEPTFSAAGRSGAVAPVEELGKEEAAFEGAHETGERPGDGEQAAPAGDGVDEVEQFLLDAHNVGGGGRPWKQRSAQRRYHGH